MTRKPAQLLIGLIAVALFAAGCSGADGASTDPWTYGPTRPGASGAVATPPSSGSSAAPSGGPQMTPSGSAPAGEAIQLTIGTDTGAALEFDPTTVSAPAGATLEVTFENRSTSVPHNLSFGAPIDKSTSTIVAAGASEALELQASEAGDYKFVCTLHPGMEGTLTIEGP